MITIKGIYRINNKIEFIDRHWYYFSDLNYLDKEKNYYMGLDPSTNSTGIWLRSTDWTNFLVVEFRRNGTGKEAYFSELREFLYKIASIVQISLIAREKPVINPRFNSDLLKELAGRIKQYIKDNEKLSIAKHVEVNNMEWKAQMVFKEKSKGRLKSKQAIAIDIVDRYPVLRPLMGNCSSTYDAFDAVGILEGYLRKYMNNEVTIQGAESYSRMIALIVSFDSIQELKQMLPKAFKVNATRKQYNKDFTLYQNIKRCRDDLVSLVEILDNYSLQTVKWKLKKREEKRYTCLLVTKYSSLKQKDKDELERLNIDYTIM